MAEFPENEVEISREYIPTTDGEMPSQKIAAVRAALSAGIVNDIQERYPFGSRRPINESAVKIRNARVLLRGFLEHQEVSTTLDKLDVAYSSLGKHEFVDADKAVRGIPKAISLKDLTVSDIEEAFATGNLTYEDWRGPANEPLEDFLTLKGYHGPGLDAQQLVATHELVGGGPERDFRLGLLKAEIKFGMRDLQNLKQAIQEYAKLLPAARTTTIDIFGIQLDLFEGFILPHNLPPLPDLPTKQLIPASMTPRQRFVAIRSALAHLTLGDQLFRKQRALSDQDRQNIIRVYDAAVGLVQESGVSADNPRRQQIQAHASLQKAKLQRHLNYLGLWDAFMPVRRYTDLKQDAQDQITEARDSADSFFKFLNLAEEEIEKQMDVAFQQDQEQASLAILDKRGENATLSVDKISEQLSAISDQQDFLVAETVVGGFRAVVEGLATKEQVGKTLGVATGAGGVVSTLVNYFAQSTELAHQRHMAEIEKEIAENDVDIAHLEKELALRRIDFYGQKLAFLHGKRLNADLLYTLAELNEKRAERQLEVAIFLSYLYERALAFFLGEPDIRHIEFDYLDRPGGIFDATKALLEDFGLVQLELDKLGEEKIDFFEETISLRESYPIQFSRFLQRGEMDFDYSLYLLSRRRPASHQCRLWEVGVEVQALVPPTGFSGLLTHHGRFLVRDKAATLDPETTRLVPTNEQLDQALEKQRREGLAVAAVGGVLFYDLEPDSKELSQNTPFVSPPPSNDQVTLRLFEGLGPTGLWHLKIEDHGQLAITDIKLHFAIVSRESDPFDLEPKVEELIHSYEAELAEGDLLDRISAFSLRQNFPDTFFALQTGPAGLSLGEENFPSGLANLQFKMVIVQALDQEGKGVAGVALEISRQEFGFNQVRITRTDGFSEDLDAPLQTLPRDQRFPVVGAWQIRLSNPDQFARLDDLRLFFMYAFEEIR